MNKFLTSKEVSTILGMTRKTLYQWRKDGIGPPFMRFGRRSVRYDVKELTVWINNSGDSKIHKDT
jgi:predicted DNA-binding transcriptional regulator AlpA